MNLSNPLQLHYPLLILTLSIIIPAHGRVSTLRRTLEYISKQTVVEEIETIIIDDVGDVEHTPQIVDFASQINLRILTVPACHQGVARNIGVQNAKGPRVLFIGDDIFLDPTACAFHISEGSKNHQVTVNRPLSIINYQSSIILGHTAWDPSLPLSPTMRWLDESGWQFDYPTLDHLRGSTSSVIIPPSKQHLYTYTSHCSLPREIALQHPFRTDVHLYGWEDTEWGMRLRNAGVPMVYDSRARALHHHHLTLEDSLRRMETLGRSARIMQSLNPEFDRVPQGMKFWAYQMAALLPTIAGKHRKAFLKGLTKI